MRGGKTLVNALAIGMLAFAGPAYAQDWPARPVTMIVPFAAGGPVDVLGRILAQYLGEVIGKQVIIDNLSGGGARPELMRSTRRSRRSRFTTPPPTSPRSRSSPMSATC